MDDDAEQCCECGDYFHPDDLAGDFGVCPDCSDSE